MKPIPQCTQACPHHSGVRVQKHLLTQSERCWIYRDKQKREQQRLWSRLPRVSLAMPPGSLSEFPEGYRVEKAGPKVFKAYDSVT